MNISQVGSGERDHPAAEGALRLNSLQSLQLAFARKRRFLLYCSLGVIAVAVDMSSYWVLVNTLAFHHQTANVLSTLCGIATSFCLNVVYTFKVRDRLFLRGVSFLAVGLIGLGLSAATLYLLIDRLHFDKNLSKLASAWVVLAQYNLNRLVSFR